MNADVDRFLEECRADPFFRNDTKAVDQIEEVLIARVSSILGPASLNRHWAGAVDGPISVIAAIDTKTR
jgi:hypothetical protein